MTQDRPVDNLDEADMNFINSVLPEGAVATAFIGIVQYVDQNGDSRWHWHCPMTNEFTNTIGLLEAVKMAVAIRQWGIETGDT